MQDLKKRVRDYFTRVKNVSRIEPCSYLEYETQLLIGTLWNMVDFYQSTEPAVSAEGKRLLAKIQELAERNADLERTRQVAIDMADDKSRNFAIAQEREAKLATACKEVVGCFNAAYAEGLHERLMESDRELGGLAGLIRRRLLSALDVSRAALAELGIETGGE